MGTGISEPRQTANSSESSARQFRRAEILFLAGSAILGIGVIAILLWFLCFAQPQESGIRISGRIESAESRVGTTVPGRIEEVAVKEGDYVSKGQLLIKIEDSSITNALAKADESIARAQELYASTKVQTGKLRRRIQQAQSELKQAPKQVPAAPLAVVQAPSAPSAEPNIDLEAKKKSGPVKTVAKVITAPVKILAQPFMAGRRAKEMKKELQSQLESASATTQANIAKNANAMSQQMSQQVKKQMIFSQINSMNTMLAQASAEVLMAEGELAKARAAKNQLLLKKNQFKIYSPIDGIVESRIVEPGDVVSPGQVLLVIMDPKRVYMRGFIPEGELANIKLGQMAHIFLDSAKTKPISAQITHIDSRASFTPENVYFKNDRVKQVFGINLSIDNPDGTAKPGMPCDARILADGEKSE